MFAYRAWGSVKCDDRQNDDIVTVVGGESWEKGGALRDRKRIYSEGARAADTESRSHGNTRVVRLVCVHPLQTAMSWFSTKIIIKTNKSYFY